MNTTPDQRKHSSSAKMTGNDSMTAKVFQESEFHYDRNRRHAKQSRVSPAISASGGPAVNIKLGATFMFLTNSEAKHLIRRLENAMTLSEAETTK